MIQTVTMAQDFLQSRVSSTFPSLYCPEKLRPREAESFLQTLLATDVRPSFGMAAVEGYSPNPWRLFRQSGYLERITKQSSAGIHRAYPRMLIKLSKPFLALIFGAESGGPFLPACILAF